MKINPAIFKAYDIRGIYNEDFDDQNFFEIAQAYVKFFKPKGRIAVGMDVRISSPQLKKAIIKGLTEAGCDVLDIGLCSTEMYYLAVGHYKLAGGIQVTASHNPKEYNGLKLVKKEVQPISKENGIENLRDMVATGWQKIKAEKPGKVEKKNVLDVFCNFSTKFLDQAKIKPFKIVINPNFGYEGEVVKRFVKLNNLPWQLIGLNDVPDGTFPKGRPDPFVPENRPEFVKLTKTSQADFGVAWDADADRVFFCDDKGNFIESYYTNHLLIRSLLIGKKGEKIVYDPRYTWALVDATKEMKGKAVLERVGHSYIKQCMRKENAIFSGESSGHTYFRDFWYADTGLIPVLILINLLATEQKKLSQLIAPIIKKYPISGEINSIVENPDKTLLKIEKLFKGGKKNKLDGLSIEYPDFRFNIRKSNTEPLLRLNVEARTKLLVKPENY